MDTLYADWAVINSGDAVVDMFFSTRLFVDDELRKTWTFMEPPLNPGSYTSIDDFSIGTLEPGIHRIRVQTDSQNVVFEGDGEGDNEYTRIIMVGPPVQITSYGLLPPGDHLQLTWTCPSTLMCRVWWSSNLTGWSMEHSTPTAQAGAWNDTNGLPWLGTFYRLSATDFEGTTKEHIEASPVSASPISGDDTNNLLNVGAILFCHTSEGRFSKFQVEGTGYNLTITWKTYNPDGSTRGSGSGLLIRGTWSCDLDVGQEVGANATRDFQWNQLTTTERDLLPRNGALFFKAY